MELKDIPENRPHLKRLVEQLDCEFMIDTLMSTDREYLELHVEAQIMEWLYDDNGESPDDSFCELLKAAFMEALALCPDQPRSKHVTVTFTLSDEQYDTVAHYVRSADCYFLAPSLAFEFHESGATQYVHTGGPASLKLGDCDTCVESQPSFHDRLLAA